MLIVSCPDCNKRLKLQTAPRSGQRVRCPGCETIFTPEVEEDRERTAAIVERADPKRQSRPKSDIIEDEEYERPARKRRRDEDDDEEDSRPRSRRDDDEDNEDERPRKKKKRRQAKAFPWMLVLSLAGAAVVVAVVVVIVVVKPFGSSSAYAKNEALAKELHGQMTDLMDAMDSVKDRNSARTAAQKINGICDRLDKIADEVKSLPKLSASDERKLKEIYEPKFKQVNSRAFSSGQRAGMSSQGEPSFLAAAQRLVQVGQKMQAAQPGWAR